MYTHAHQGAAALLVFQNVADKLALDRILAQSCERVQSAMKGKRFKFIDTFFFLFLLANFSTRNWRVISPLDSTLFSFF